MSDLATCDASTIPRLLLGGEIGARQRRLSIGASAYRIPLKEMILAESSLEPMNVPSRSFGREGMIQVHGMNIYSQSNSTVGIATPCTVTNRDTMSVDRRNMADEILKGVLGIVMYIHSTSAVHQHLHLGSVLLLEGKEAYAVLWETCKQLMILEQTARYQCNCS